MTPDELVLRQLLPMADEGLRRWGVAGEVRDRYLGVIEGRAKTGRNGAAWQVVDRAGAAGARDDPPATRWPSMLRRYLRPHAQQRTRAHLGRCNGGVGWVAWHLT